MDKAQEEPRRIVSAVVDPVTADRLEQLAREADRSLNAVIGRALREHLEQPAHSEACAGCPLQARAEIRNLGEIRPRRGR